MPTLPSLLLAALQGALGAGPAPPLEESSGPAAESAIVVVLDDVGWEDLGAVPTPHLDAIGALGRTYPRTYGSCVCSPSRYQLVFGRYPSHDFIGTALSTAASGGGAPTTTTSIAATLRAEGFRTGAFGKWHINSNAGGQAVEAARRHGFETWRAGLFGNLTGTLDHYDWQRMDDGVKSVETTYTTTAIESAFEEWWTSNPGRKFGYLAFAAAHAPHQAPPAELLPPGYFVGSLPRQKYESAVIGLDHAIGRLVEYVDLSKTLVLIVCDNGTPEDVPPNGALFKGYKQTQFEGGIRVPLLAAGAGVAAGNDSSLIQVVDLPRTVLGALGVVPEVGFEDSISFAATLSGSAAGDRRWAFVQRFAPNGGEAAALTIDDWAVVWSDRWKVLVNGGGAAQVYDLSTDPTELSDLAQTAAGAARAAAALGVRAEVLGPDWPY